MNADEPQSAPLVTQTVERFLARRCSPESWSLAAASDEGWSREHWRDMAELGWLGACLPEAEGGMGCGIDERMAVMEAIGRGLSPEPYLSCAVLCAELVLACGSAAQRKKLLPAISGGTLVLAFAASDPGARFAVQDVSCRAERVGTGWRISGRKIAVLDAPSADRLIVLARTAGTRCDAHGLSLFLIDPRTEGCTMRTYPTVDRRRCADIDFDAMLLGESALLGMEGKALDSVNLALDHAMVATSAEAVGAMTELIRMTIDFLKQRQQFGKPLASLQVLRHRVADMHIACEQSRSLTHASAATLLAGHPRRSINAAAAKAQAGWSARFVGQQAVQLHGGIGVSDELSVGHYFKRLMMTNVLFGNADHHVRRFGELGAALAEFS